MNIQDLVSSAIARAIDDVNAQLPSSSRLSKAPETILFGREAGLDSLGLINFIVALEKHVEDGCGRAVSLSTPEVMLADDSPFASIRALHSYLISVLETDSAR
jgi:acyl carrier protein